MAQCLRELDLLTYIYTPLFPLLPLSHHIIALLSSRRGGPVFARTRPTHLYIHTSFPSFTPLIISFIALLCLSFIGEMAQCLRELDIMREEDRRSFLVMYRDRCAVDIQR